MSNATNLYRIENISSGHSFGIYEGENGDEAIASMCTDAASGGACDYCGYPGDIIATLVTESDLTDEERWLYYGD